jgi:hypothetical protein
LEVEHHWLRTTTQLMFVERTWNVIQEQHRDSLLSILKILRRKLKAAQAKFNGLTKRRTRGSRRRTDEFRVKRWKYLFVKPYLDSVILDLAKWQRLFDPCWYLIMRIASSQVDRELHRDDPVQLKEMHPVLKTARKIRQATRSSAGQAREVFLGRESDAGIITRKIPMSSATLLQRPGSSAPFIIDNVPCQEGMYVGITTEDLRRLASKLRAIDPITFGVLKCRGVIKNHNENRTRLTSFDLVLETPQPGEACSLRKRLAADRPESLSDRVNLAKQLATSVCLIHTIDFVHKNIRPENILRFGEVSKSAHGAAFLIGFQHFRSVDGLTYMRGDDEWARNIYRHPERQGLHPQERYRREHDIYSLGVCLLEIGLWETFVVYNADETSVSPGAGLALMLQDLRQMPPDAVQKHLVGLAESRLPVLMGNIYTQIVVECLDVLKPDGEDDGGDEDGSAAGREEEAAIIEGVQCIEQVNCASRRPA